MNPETLFIIDGSILLITLIVLYFSKIDFQTFNPVNVHIYFYVLYILLSQLLVMMFILLTPENKFLQQLVAVDENYWKINILIMSCFFSFIMGAAFCNNFLLTLRRNIVCHNNISTGHHEHFISGVLFVILFFDLMILLFFYKTYGIPLFSSDIDEARYIMTERGGIKYMFLVYMYTNPYIATIFLRQYFRGDKSLLVFSGILLSFLIQLSSILTGFRNYIIIYIIILAGAYTLYKKVGIKKQLFLASSSFLVISFVTFLKYRDEVLTTPMTLLIKVFHRLIFESLYSLNLIFRIFDHNNYLMGYSYWLDLFSKMPGKQFSFGGYLAEKTGNASHFFALTPTLPGEFYANFGWFSIFIYCAYGSFLALLSEYLKQQINSEAKLRYYVAYIMLFVFALRSVIVGIGGVFDIAIVVPAFFLSVYILFVILKGIEHQGIAAEGEHICNVQK